MKILLAFILFFFGCTSKNQDSEKSLETTTNEDQSEITLTDFEFTDLEGKRFSAEKYKGKPVFMHFWATWCRPCIQEMPGIESIIGKIEDVHFVFPSDEQLAKIKSFKNSHNFSFDYLQLTSGFAQAGVSALPTTYLFNNNGELHEVIVGARNWNTEEAVANLKKLTDQ